MTKSRGRRWLAILAIAFIVVPLLEIYVLIQVGHVIGVWWTILLLVADSILGGWLIRREGSRAWRALRAALDEGRMPHRELTDGVLIVLGGALMLSPGFVTDVLGIVLILPFTRPVFRRMLASYAASRATVYAGVRTQRRPGPSAGDESVVRGEVIDDQR